MQIAVVDGTRLEAFPGGRGVCPVCGSEVIAKCGTRIIYHWAHQRPNDCDPWWENETPWHRNWKNLFPEGCREVSHTASDGEIHRSDIKTPTGIFIEIQHSAMTDAERESREEFYKNLVWIIDGAAFHRNFDIYHPLPDPHADFARDLVWAKAKRGMEGANRGIFFRWSEACEEYPRIAKKDVTFGCIHGIDEVRDALEESYRGHHQYHWIRPRKTWIDAACPVYIDFGKGFLARLETYDDSDLRCVRLIDKAKFIHDVMTQVDAHQIAP